MSVTSKLWVCGLAMGLSWASAQAAPVEQTVMTASNRPFTQEVQILGQARAQAPITLQIALKLRDFDALQQRINQGEQVAYPELERTYLPRTTDHQALLRWLQAQGFTVKSYPHRLSMTIKGTVAQVQKAFVIPMAQVVVGGKSYLASASLPSLPKNLAAFVVGINGLQPYQRAYPLHHLQPQSPTVPYTDPYAILDIRKAYKVTQKLTGAGQKIGIVIDVFPLDSDLTTFWANSGIPQSLSNIEKVAVGGSASSGPTSAEETLDTEMTSGIASAAKIRIYASGSLAFTDIDNAYAQILADLPNQPQLHQVSMSYGACEQLESPAQVATDHQYFAAITSQGVSLFASSGDSGSFNLCLGQSGDKASNPSSDPNVTSVGGTTLKLDATGSVTKETAWGCSSTLLCTLLGGSGGGTSSAFTRPIWQTGFGVPAGAQRLVPDISLVGDPATGVYVIYKGKVSQFGGTSVSAPLWNAFAALLNQDRKAQGLTPLGLFAPYIYPLIGSTAPYGAPTLRDITEGSNGTFSAGAGYDQVTGVGVPDFNRLLNRLNRLTP